jgi:hypothetical protein
MPHGLERMTLQRPVADIDDILDKGTASGTEEERMRADVYSRSR